MRRSQRNPEHHDEQRERPRPSVDELEAEICRLQMELATAQREIEYLRDNPAERRLAQVVNVLQLRHAYKPHYIFTAVTQDTRRELAEMLHVEAAK